MVPSLSKLLPTPLKRQIMRMSFHVDTTFTFANRYSIARDPNVPADARLRAGFRGIGDRFKANKHGRSADAHKHAAKHNY